MNDMLKFTQVDQHYPQVAPAQERKTNFDEIYGQFDPAEAAVQSARCSQCGIPFCQIHCPLSNNIPDWLKLTAEGRLEEAYAISSATNTFPEICGRICPQDRLCEGNCVIEKGFKSVTIGSVEKYITETAFANGWVKPIHVTRETGLSVGIIGAGPAGLAAADMLRQHGHEVHVYDRYDRVGGLLIYGIPNFKLDKQVVLRRQQLLKDGGIHFHMNVDIGKTITLEELRQKHTAVLIATGVYKSRDIDIPDCSLENILPALEYLTASNRNNLGDKVANFDNGLLNAAGKEVVVIGGHGLRTHRGAPGCKESNLPVPPRPRQHARQHARSKKCRGRRRAVHVAVRSQSVRWPQKNRTDHCAAHAPYDAGGAKQRWQQSSVRRSGGRRTIPPACRHGD